MSSTLVAVVFPRCDCDRVALASVRLAFLSHALHVPVAAGTVPILRCVNPKGNALSCVELFERHLHVLSHGLATHRGQEPMLNLLDARLGHFSDPLFVVLLVIICHLLFERPSA